LRFLLPLSLMLVAVEVAAVGAYVAIALAVAVDGRCWRLKHLFMTERFLNVPDIVAGHRVLRRQRI
jgi:hypothetical protein